MRPRPRSRKAWSQAAVRRCSMPRACSSTRSGANHDQQVGIEIVRRALQAPVRQIAENATSTAQLLPAGCSDQKDVNFGFDAQKWSTST